MSLDRLQQAWKAESSQVRVTFDPDRIEREVQQSHDAFRSTIFWRDVREVGVALVMIPFWIALGVGTSSPWTWYLGIPAFLWTAGFMLIDRRLHPQRPSDPGEPLMFHVKESLGQVEHQIWLLRNVFWWYLLPFCLALGAFFVHVSWNVAGSWWGAILMASVPGTIVYFVYRWVYRLNQVAVEKQLEPRRNYLRKVVDHLESESSDEDSDELIDLVSALSDSGGNGGLSCNRAAWAENWNRIIPSWTVVAMILVPTLLGAYGGWRFAFQDFGPVFFQSVCAAVIPFEIAFFGRWYWIHRRLKDQPLNGKGPTRPNAPAVFMIVMTVVIGLLALAAVVTFAFLHDARGPGLADVSAFTNEDITHIDDWLQRAMDDCYPSLSAIVVVDGHVVYKGAFGVEDKESSRPTTTRTHYNVASVTKVFTASLAVMLHERGIVDLDETALSYLPDEVRISTTPKRGATITLRELAAHTSGLPRSVPGQVQTVEGRYALEPKLLYDLLENTELVSDPGATREYSNLGFGLLGHVLERAAGKTLDQLIQEWLCGPLQLEGTAIEGNARLRPATGYARASRGGLRTTHSLRERMAGSGGLVTTTEDLGRFLAAQMKPGVFTADMLEQLHSETMLSNGAPSSTALGWSVSSIKGAERILEKNGGRSNCSAWIGFSPKHKVAVAIVTNCGGPQVDSLGHRLLEQSIPLSQRRLVSDDGYAKVAPFTGVRWEDNQPIVCVYGKWSPLLSIDGVSSRQIMEFANKQYGGKAQKRFAEDLVEVLTKMGHQPDWHVSLELKSQDGSIEQVQVLMTKENRDLVWNRGKAE